MRGFESHEDDYHNHFTTSFVFCAQALEVIKTTQLGKLRAGGVSEVVTDPLQVFHEAIENCKPIMGTSGVRRGGKLYHVSVGC